MNILYLINHLNIGGITSYSLALSRGIIRRGHRVYVASSGGEMLSEFIKEGALYIHIPINTKQEVGPKIMLCMFKLLPVIKKNNIDLIHSNSRTTQVLGSLLSIFTGTPHISTCHGFFKKRFFRRIFPCWGKKTIAISEPVKEHLCVDFKVRPENIAVIHNGIDTCRFAFEKDTLQARRAVNRKVFGLNTNDFVVGIIARLSGVKGHVYLIRAMQTVIDKYPQAKLLIVGEGKMKDELLKLSRNLGIKNKVFLRTEACDTASVLSSIDIFVMPSLKEGLGLALMEAMAFGLAVIGSNVGGIKSLIQDGHSGLLAEPGNIEQLSAAIIDLLNDAKKREFLGNNARDYITKNFSQEKMVLETEKAYLECLSAKD